MRFRGIIIVALVGALLVGLLPGSVSAAGKVHRVESGQSLWGIARRYGVTVKALRRANDLGSSSKIKPGQELRIPKKGDSKAKKEERADSDREEKKGRDSDREEKKDRKPWYLRKPSTKTQTQKTAKKRGINPCNTPDPGFGIYDRWNRAPSIGQMILPQSGGVTRSGRFDVMFHFHGHEAVRKEWVRVMRGTVLVGIDLGIGSGPYASTFRSPGVFEKLLKSVEAAVAKQTGKEGARARKIGLSAWSAGYGAVEQILRHPGMRGRVDSVVLLDGLHSGYSGSSLNDAQMQPFVDFARRARRGRGFMFVSHSSIIPPGYASTTETANYLIWKMGGKPRHTRPRSSDPMGLDLISRYSRGNFHVRGYAGNDKMDHCAHIGLYRDVLKVHIRRRWKSPRGRKRR